MIQSMNNRTGEKQEKHRGQKHRGQSEVPE
jgi:hypothetical protein